MLVQDCLGLGGLPYRQLGYLIFCIDAASSAASAAAGHRRQLSIEALRLLANNLFNDPRKYGILLATPHNRPSNCLFTLTTSVDSDD